MKRQIRREVFETNSSSTHSLTMCMKSEFDQWANGEVYLNECTGLRPKFVSKEEVIDILKDRIEDLLSLSDEEFDEAVRDWEFYTCDNYDNEYLEWFDDEFTTPSGETVVCFGQYGHD